MVVYNQHFLFLHVAKLLLPQRPQKLVNEENQGKPCMGLPC
jgi:hypothetical protein